MPCQPNFVNHWQLGSFQETHVVGYLFVCFRGLYNCIWAFLWWRVQVCDVEMKFYFLFICFLAMLMCKMIQEWQQKPADEVINFSISFRWHATEKGPKLLRNMDRENSLELFSLFVHWKFLMFYNPREMENALSQIEDYYNTLWDV